MDSQNLQTVRKIWAVLERHGMCAAMEAMLARCHEDVELRSYVADGRTLIGVDEIREFFYEREAAGANVHASPWTFEESGDEVTVSGSIRVQRPDGSIADAQLRWTYSFSDGLISHAEFAPLAAAVAS
jgi:ketosteroid isomerase-like protein